MVTHRHTPSDRDPDAKLRPANPERPTRGHDSTSHASIKPTKHVVAARHPAERSRPDVLHLSSAPRPGWASRSRCQHAGGAPSVTSQNDE
jgi:hypothetical protein